MKITGFIWLSEILEKIETKHKVSPIEVREVLDGNPKFRFVEKGYHLEENVYTALGQSSAGRFLIVFFIYKKDKRALILSARDMTEKERRKYEEK